MDGYMDKCMFNRSMETNTYASIASDVRNIHMLKPDTIIRSAILTRKLISAEKRTNKGIYHKLKSSDNGSPKTGIPIPTNGFHVIYFCGSEIAFLAN